MQICSVLCLDDIVFNIAEGLGLGFSWAFVLGRVTITTA